MRQSNLFARTLKEEPKNEPSVNARLLIRAGFIDKVMAGVYTFLPLGLRVLKKIEKIIREEIIAAGGQEILMPTLTPIENYKKTDRQNLDVLFKTKLYNDAEFVLNQSHEEVVTPLVKQFCQSYKDLPKYVFQIQNKFRNEQRAKSGLFRGREFIMKDLYSFHADAADLDNYYEKIKKAYLGIFARFGIGDKTYLTFASGGTFSKYSHEYQTLCQAGEDEIYLCPDCAVAVNKEIIVEQKVCPNCGNEKLEPKKAIEVGNIFKLMDKFSRAFDYTYTDEQGKRQPVIMGCYGIGLSRSMGTIVEIHHDEKGIIWPKTVAPFDAHLVSLCKEEPDVKQADAVYQSLLDKGVEVLYDDRTDASAGQKFADSDLIGIPKRIVVSPKTLSTNQLEVKQRGEEGNCLVKISELFT